jgi:chromosome partitioning protein
MQGDAVVRLDAGQREALGAFLKMQAQRSGWTQAELADELALDRTLISRLYRGRVVADDHYKALTARLGLEWEGALEGARRVGEVDVSVAPKRARARAQLRLTVCAEKGGVGKTTTAVTLASVWAAAGERVLLVDLDTQGNATAWLTGTYDERQGADLLESLRHGAELAPVQTAHGVDVVASGRRMAEAADALKSQTAGFKRLAKLLEATRGVYDVVVIDTPPSLGLVTINALMAATHVLLPAQANGFSLDALDKTLETCEEVRDELNEGLEILGAVFVNYDKRTVISREMKRELDEHPGLEHLGTIHGDVRVAESATVREPLVAYAPGARAAMEYTKLAGRLLEQMRGGDDEAR